MSNKRLKAEVIALFGRDTVESAIAFPFDAIQFVIHNPIQLGNAAKQLREISNPIAKVSYAQSLDLVLQQALIVRILNVNTSVYT